MKHKFITLLLLFVAAAALLSGTAAASDVVDDFAASLTGFETQIDVPVRDYDALMKETFSRYPELFFYYNGSSYVSNSDGLSITVYYRNTDESLDDVYVVRTQTQLMAAIGLGLCDAASEVDIVLADGLTVTRDDVYALFEQLSTDFYLVSMGWYQYSPAVPSYVQEEWGVSWFHLRVGYGNGADQETVLAWRDTTESALLELTTTLLALDMPDYEKVLLAHDYLVDNCVYNMDDLTEMDWENHMAYGALVPFSCVCQGYAEAFQLLMEAVGIESVYVTGEANGGSHGWNCGQLDGEWYMIDVTWDDPVTTDGSDMKRYDYFNITSEQLSQDHTWDESAYPACEGTALNYETVRELMDGDTTTYTEYSTELVRTQEIERAELLALLEGDADDATGDESEDGEEPDDTTDDASEDGEEPGDAADDESEDSEEPDDTTGDETKDGEDPDTSEDSEDDSDLPDLREVLPITKDEKNGSLAWIKTLLIALAIAVACGGGAALAVYLISENRIRDAREERKTQRDRRVANYAPRRRF